MDGFGAGVVLQCRPRASHPPSISKQREARMSNRANDPRIKALLLCERFVFHSPFPG